ncbi:MAG: hypothetical protein ACI3Z5_03695 [Paludibacteraceae bacterium]
MTESIGGYFELELRKGEHYHKNALRLNTARNCFEYILRARKYTKVYIPYYTCEVMLEPLKKCNVEYAFYHINEQLEPIETFVLMQNEAFLYTNYYGLKQRCVERLAEQYGKQLIVDNAQAFFAEPLEGIDTFYSARKFFGVADGAYLYTEALLDMELEQDQSYQRMAHLLIRADIGAEEGYSEFRKNDDSLIDNPIRLMSNLTEKILCSIDYESAKQLRRSNYMQLNEQLSAKNGIHLTMDEDAVPMVYPYLTDDTTLRQCLIANRIYVATYWPNVEKAGSFEDILRKELLPLPTDQRIYSTTITKIFEVINE